MRSVRPARLALVVLLTALAACGGNGEDKADFNRRKAICDGIVLDPAAPQTVRDLARRFDFATLLPSGCTNQLLSTGTPDDHCPYVDTANVCRILVAYQAVDQDLCNQGRCVYYCELRTLAAPGDPAPATNIDAPVCARRFVSGQ